MAYINEEFDHALDDGYQPENYDLETPEVITVRFSIEGGKARGCVVTDVRGKARSKIVFPARSWIGPQPTHGEEMKVTIVHETNEPDPRRGVLFVERIIPLARMGGHHSRCVECADYTVPIYDAKTRGWLTYSSCERCGTFHKLDWKR